MTGVRNIGHVMDHHYKIQSEAKPNPAQFSAMRKCAGPCRKRKSIAQFTGASEHCHQCARRAPKPQGIAA